MLVVLLVLTAVGSFAVGMMGPSYSSMGTAPAGRATTAGNAPAATSAATPRQSTGQGANTATPSMFGTYSVNTLALQDGAGEFQYYTTTGSVTASERGIAVDFGAEVSAPVHLEGSFIGVSDDFAYYEITGESGLEALGLAGYYGQCFIGSSEGSDALVLVHDMDVAEPENMMALLLERK